MSALPSDQLLQLQKASRLCLKAPEPGWGSSQLQRAPSCPCSAEPTRAPQDAGPSSPPYSSYDGSSQERPGVTFLMILTTVSFL